MNNFKQFAMFSTTVTAVLFTQIQSTMHLAPFVGLIGQPFWIEMSVRTKQWGVLLCALLHSAIWIYGAVNNV